jgi:hypothetical protein
MKTAAVIGVVVVLALALGWMYEFRPVPTWWVDLRMDSLGVGRIEAMKTNGGFFMTGEGEVYFRDPLDHEAQGAFRWNYDYPVGGETPELFRMQLANARADAVRSEQILRAFHARGFRNVQLRYTSGGQDVSLAYPGLLLFDEDPNVDSARRRLADSIARKLVPPSARYELVFLPEGHHVSDAEIFDLQDESDLDINNPGETVTSN